jgi:hypothetical protein
MGNSDALLCWLRHRADRQYMRLLQAGQTGAGKDSALRRRLQSDTRSHDSDAPFFAPSWTATRISTRTNTLTARSGHSPAATCGFVTSACLPTVKNLMREREGEALGLGSHSLNLALIIFLLLLLLYLVRAPN